MIKSPFSKSTAIAGLPAGRAIATVHKQGDLPSIKAENRAAARFVLRADISRFYESIYTHSIAWALHGKADAKMRQRDMGLLGNVLDKRLRQGNDNQSVGIPIGPDSSLVIAEILLTAVDTRLESRIPDILGHRYVDDYEFCFMDRTAAEDALVTLQDVLSEFELALNPLKTEIIETPLETEAHWVHELRRFSFRTGATTQATDIRAYFDAAFSLSRQFPQEYVLKYAVGRLKGVRVRPKNWQLFQSLLTQAMVADPGTIVLVLQRLFQYRAKGFQLDRTSLQRALSEVISCEARMGHGNEVAWAAWACIALRIQIRADPAGAMSRMQDSVVALLALHAQDAGLIRSQLDTSTWSSHMNLEGLYGDQWLLSYEARLKGWLPSQGPRDHVNADANFAFLKRNRVQFYDVGRAVPMIPTGVAASAGTAELFSLPLDG